MNILSSKMSSKYVEKQICHCSSEDDCGKSCQNNAMQFECSPESCPCKGKCQNNRFQMKKYMLIERFNTKQKGLGVRTKETIKEGAFIIEYVGEVITLIEYKERLKTIYENDNNFYGMTLDSQLMIDARSYGNISRYINHSCQPNCQVLILSIVI